MQVKGNWDGQLQSVQNKHESKANDGLQESQVDASVNHCEKCIIPDDLLPVAYSSKTLTLKVGMPT